MHNNIKVIQGNYTVAQDAQFGIIASRFNSFIVDSLLDGCLDTLSRHGIANSNITVVKVPGARDMLPAAKRMAASHKYHALIALGAVIRGATPHFDYVADSCSMGLAAISTEFDLPVSFGVLTLETIEQGIERAGTKSGNKGADAALVALEMVSLMRQLSP